MRKLLLLCLFFLSSSAFSDTNCFDEEYYRDFYPDVATDIASGKFPDAASHFQSFGKAQGRVACPRNDLETLCAIKANNPRSCNFEWGPVNTSAIDYRLHRNIIAGVAIFAMLLFFFLKNELFILGILASAMSTFAFWPYLSGARVFVFRDIATDTIDQFWPTIYYLSEMIYKGEFPFWSHAAGMGQAVFPSWLSDPFMLFAILSGPSKVTYMIGFVNFLKPIFASLFIGLFLKEKKYHKAAIIIGALSIAFCGHFIARVSWYHYASEVVAVSFYLYALERYLNRGKMVMLAIATAVFALPGTHQAYINGMLATVYIMVRLLAFSNESASKRWRQLFTFFGLSIMGALLVSPILSVDVYQTLTSNRVAGKWSVYGSVFDIPLTDMTAYWTLLTALSRLLSPSLLGDPGQYLGAGNFLEDSAVYAGVLAIPFFITAAVVFRGRYRALTIAFLAMIILYHVFSHFRLIFNAYAGLYFKISNFWMQVGLGLFLASFLNYMQDEKKRWPWIVLAVNIALTLGLLHWLKSEVKLFASLVDVRIADLEGTSLAIGLAVAILGTFIKKRRDWLFSLLIFAVVVDLGFNSYYVFDNNRKSLDGKYYGLQSGYFDAAYQLIKKVQEREHSPYYRIERDFNSVQLNDSLIQNYLGTKSYFSFTNPAYSEFLSKIGRFGVGARPESYLEGLGHNALMLHLLGIQYFLSSEPSTLPGFTTYLVQDHKMVLKSKFDLSMGFVYESSIGEEALTNLSSPIDRQLVMLDGLLLKNAPVPAGVKGSLNRYKLNIPASTAAVPDNKSSINWDLVLERIKQLERRRATFAEVSSNRIAGSVTTDVDGYLFLPVAYDKGWQVEIDGERVAFEAGNFGFIATQIKAGSHKFVLNYLPPTLIPGLIGFLIGFIILLLISRSRMREQN